MIKPKAIKYYIGLLYYLFFSINPLILSFYFKSLIQSGPLISNLYISFINNITFILDISYLTMIGFNFIFGFWHCLNIYYHYRIWKLFK